MVEVAVAVDPLDPKRIIDKLHEIDQQIILTHLLLTHKHWDHAGGNKVLKEQYPDLVVIGSATDFPKYDLLNNYFSCINRRVVDGEKFMIGRLPFKVLLTPCHTMGSVMYLLEIDKIEKSKEIIGSSKNVSHNYGQELDQILDLDAPSLFTGDTIFSGKFFEGDASDMHAVVQRLLLDVDENTLIWPGHEYTESNLEFANQLEPNNAALTVRYRQATTSRSKSLCTVPSTWKYELMTNPFLRIDARTRDDELWLNIKKEARKLNIDTDSEIAKLMGKVNENPKDLEEIVMLNCLRSLKDNWKSRKIT